MWSKVAKILDSLTWLFGAIAAGLLIGAPMWMLMLGLI